MSQNGHAAKLVIKHLEREGWVFEQIRSSSKEMEEGKKKLGLDKDENHVEPLQPPRSIPTLHQSLQLNKTTKSEPYTSNIQWQSVSNIFKISVKVQLLQVLG